MSQTFSDSIGTLVWFLEKVKLFFILQMFLQIYIPAPSILYFTLALMTCTPIKFIYFYKIKAIVIL